MSSWGGKMAWQSAACWRTRGTFAPSDCLRARQRDKTRETKCKWMRTFLPYHSVCPYLWPAKQFYVDACAFPSNLVRGDEQVTNSWPETRSPNYIFPLSLSAVLSNHLSTTTILSIRNKVFAVTALRIDGNRQTLSE